jgi:hypothetical protein
MNLYKVAFLFDSENCSTKLAHIICGQVYFAVFPLQKEMQATSRKCRVIAGF